MIDNNMKFDRSIKSKSTLVLHEEIHLIRAFNASTYLEIVLNITSQHFN